MNSSSKTLADATSADADLAEQARPGYGIPSQDPSPAAQVSMQPEEADREAKSVFVGGGMMAGAAAGATLGVVAGGPVGVLVGGTVGAIAGALGGQAAGTVVKPENATDVERPVDVRSRPPEVRPADPGRT